MAEGLLVTAVGRTSVVCSAQEYLQFQPTNGQSCETYMQPYISAAGGYLLDPQATDTCNFCQIADTDVFLSSFAMSYNNRWVRLAPVVKRLWILPLTHLPAPARLWPDVGLHLL